MISSAVLCQTKGLGSSLQCSTQVSITTRLATMLRYRCQVVADVSLGDEEDVLADERAL